MLTTEAHRFLSPEIRTASTTQAAPSETSALEAQVRQRWRQAWKDIIDHQLIEWGRDPEQLADDGVAAPSREVVRLAIAFAKQMQNQDFQPAQRVVPDANGGIVFERRESDVVEVIHIWDDGMTEYQLFRGLDLVERHELHVVDEGF